MDETCTCTCHHGCPCTFCGCRPAPGKDRLLAGLRAALARSEERERALREALPDDLRAAGWVVAIHNDYRQGGEAHTFWLFTQGNHCAKGEGRTDSEALDKVRAALSQESPAPAAAPGDADRAWAEKEGLDLAGDETIGFRHNAERAHPCDFCCGGSWVCIRCRAEWGDDEWNGGNREHVCSPAAPTPTKEEEEPHEA